MNSESRTRGATTPSARGRLPDTRLREWSGLGPLSQPRPARETPPRHERGARVSGNRRRDRLSSPELSRIQSVSRQFFYRTDNKRRSEMRENGLMTAEYPREGRALKRRRAPTGVAIGRATAGELSSPTSVR